MLSKEVELLTEWRMSIVGEAALELKGIEKGPFEAFEFDPIGTGTAWIATPGNIPRHPPEQQKGGPVGAEHHPRPTPNSRWEARWS